jgi:hypothetical protein
MFSRWIVTNITSARGTLHCRKTRIPCRDELLICGQYTSDSRYARYTVHSDICAHWNTRATALIFKNNIKLETFQYTLANESVQHQSELKSL